jgi:MFS family permease
LGVVLEGDVSSESGGQPAAPAVGDRVTPYGWKVLAGSVVGYSMDGFDLLILGFMLAAISGDLGLTSAQAGSLVTWTLGGAVAGGFIFGTLSDHVGRIKVLTWTIVIFALFTGLCAFARGWDRRVGSRGLGPGRVRHRHGSPPGRPQRARVVLRRNRVAGGVSAAVPSCFR